MKELILKLVYFIIVALLVYGCDKKPVNPTDVSLTDFPFAPTNLKAAIGDGKIVLTWVYDDTVLIDKYKVFRRTAMDQDFTEIGSATGLSFTDVNLTNNTEFQYLDGVTTAIQTQISGNDTDIASNAAGKNLSSLANHPLQDIYIFVIYQV